MAPRRKGMAAGTIVSKTSEMLEADIKPQIADELIQEELNQKEIFWINKLNCLNESVGYNIATGGAFGDSGYHLGMLGKSQSEKQKSAARNYQLNNPKTTQMKEKMHKANLIS